MAPPSPQFRIGGFFITLYLVTGAFAGYGGIWLAEQGIEPTRIGIINATPIAFIIVLNMWSGRLADRAHDWKHAIVLLVALSALGPFGLLIAGQAGFWPILLCWTLFAVAHGLTVPVTDAAAMRMALREGFDYAGLRAWGTIGYIIAVFLAGWLVAVVGPWTFLPLLAAAAVARLIGALGLPRFRAALAAPIPAPAPALIPQEDGAAPAVPPPTLPAPALTHPHAAGRLRDVFRPWFVLPLLGWLLIAGTFAVLNVFQVLLWQQQGLPEGWLPLVFATGPISEAAMFFGFRRIARRFSARQLMLASALIAVFRWLCYAFEPGIPLLIPLQMLHAFTYAMGFLGCLGFIANWTSEDIAAEAQGFFVVLQQIGSVVAILGFGWLAQSWGSGAYFGSAAFALLGAALIWASLRLQEPAAR